MSRAAALSFTCSARLTPMSVEVIPGRPQTQASAIRAGVSPAPAAIFFRPSTMVQLRGVKSVSPNGLAPSKRLSPSGRFSFSAAASLVCRIHEVAAQIQVGVEDGGGTGFVKPPACRAEGHGSK